MDEIITALADQHAELADLLAGLDDDGWARPSRCEGWSVSDVVLHLAQTDEMALASLDDLIPEYLAAAAEGLPPAANVDDGAGAMVEKERGEPGSAVRDRWQHNAEELVERFNDTDLSRRVTWVAGELSARTLAATRVSETWIHTGDVAEALRIELAPTDRLRYIARLAWRTLPYAFARAGQELTGAVAFLLTGPNGDAWNFVPEAAPLTTVAGPATDLCDVAARRIDPADTALRADGPDAAAVLELVRTYA